MHRVIKGGEQIKREGRKRHIYHSPSSGRGGDGPTNPSISFTRFDTRERCWGERGKQRVGGKKTRITICGAEGEINTRRKRPRISDKKRKESGNKS